MKKTFLIATIATSVLAVAQTVSAQTTILTDNFTVTPAGAGSGGAINSQLSTRQTGTAAPSTYSYNSSGQDQVGNNTYVGQPGGQSATGNLSADDNTDFLMLYNNGWVLNNLALNDTVDGGMALSISFNLYQGTFNGQGGTDWTSFSVGTAAAPNDSGQFGFLVQGNGGIQIFNGGAKISTLAQDTAGYAISDGWTVTLSGNAAGTTSPFDGTTYVLLYNNADPANGEDTGLGLVDSFELTTALTAGDEAGFLTVDGSGDFNEAGIANLDIAAVPEPSAPVLAAAGLGLLALIRRFRRA